MTGPDRGASPPKLVILSHEFDPHRGGVATYVGELATAIHRAGRSVEVWAPAAPDSEALPPFAFPVTRLRCGGSLRVWDSLRWMWEIFARRRELRSSTVLLASVGAHRAFLVLLPLGLVRGRRILSLLHGSEVLRFQRNPIWRILARRFYARVHSVFAVSRFSKSLIERSFLSACVKEIVVAPCACSSDAVRTTDRERQSDGTIRILTLARLHPRKGQLDTARALAMLPVPLRDPVVYQVGGTGDQAYQRQVEQVCRDAGIRCQFLGLVAPRDLATVYAHCDIFAMTSRALPRSVEGFGIAYLDAAFHGKPIVAYRSGGAAEAVVDGESGLLVDEGDLASLAHGFERLITDPDLRRRLGTRGRQHAAKFSWDETARVVLSRDVSGCGCTPEVT